MRINFHSPIKQNFPPLSFTKIIPLRRNKNLKKKPTILAQNSIHKTATQWKILYPDFKPANIVE
jgi:hypothetical protein